MPMQYVAFIMAATAGKANSMCLKLSSIWLGCIEIEIEIGDLGNVTNCQKLIKYEIKLTLESISILRVKLKKKLGRWNWGALKNKQCPCSIESFDETFMEHWIKLVDRFFYLKNGTIADCNFIA